MQDTYATGVKPAKTRWNAKPGDCATPFDIPNHLSATQQGNWLAGQTRPDLSCQISLYMPSPSVRQIRRANAWVRRAHQFEGIEIAQAEIRMHVDLNCKSQCSELGAGTLGVGHVHARHGSVPAFCLENKDTYIQRFSAISVIDCKCVLDIVMKPGAPTGIDDKRCATDMAIIRGCVRRMG